MKLSPKMATILSLSLLSACSATKDMDNMSKTTQDMSAKTASMADTTAHLAVTNDSVLNSIKDTNTTAKDTDTSVKQSTVAVQSSNIQTMRIANAEELIYMDGRPPATKETRRNAIEDMQKGKDIREKANEAGAYFSAFEYQAWKGAEADTPAEQDALYDAAMKEFTRELGEYLPSDLTKIDATSTDDKSLNLFALSIAAQEVYENALPGTLSMLDLIEQALALNNDVNTKKGAEAGLKAWQKEVLANYPELVYFLQVRTNFFAAMTLGKLNLGEIAAQAALSDPAKSLPAKAELGKDLMLGWKMDLAPANVERIASTITFADCSQKQT
jgi:hypothetical protein